MKTVFADTVFLVALASERDQSHAAATRWVQEQGSARILTTDFVLLEVANFFSTGARRQAFATLRRALLANARVRIVPASRSLVDRAIDLFESHDDKEWSLTDCTSFVVMRRLRLKEALTADRHSSRQGSGR